MLECIHIMQNRQYRGPAVTSENMIINTNNDSEPFISHFGNRGEGGWLFPMILGIFLPKMLLPVMMYFTGNMVKQFYRLLPNYR